VRAEATRSRAVGVGSLVLASYVLASGCYHGTARTATPADLADPHDGWNRVDGVPPVRQIAREDCGAAALAMVLGYWGVPITREAIGAGTGNPVAPGPGIRAAALRDFARRQGLQAFLVQGELADLDREVGRNRPVLVGVMKRYGGRIYPHYEVVVGVSRGTKRVLTLDPAHGLRVNSREGFIAEWTAAGRLTLIVFPFAGAVPSS
jgi:ABC-type bacteriocin/lantibiotic exporter with double-glycine peptidase domain